MSTNPVEAERNFERSLISTLANAWSSKPGDPTKQDIMEMARQLAPLNAYEGELEVVVERVRHSIDTRMGAGVSLVDAEASHDDQWVSKRNDIKWTYSQAYEEFLKDERWHPRVVQELSDVGTRILGHLQDPNSKEAWDRRGLVIGHVQSGKTANYMSVITKAADAGYKFIIVIAGIHNNLRKQTQERIEEGFVGRSSDPDNNIAFGVGRNDGYPHPMTLTNVNDDFNKTTAAQSRLELNDFRKPIIFVIKKNVHTLNALHRWLKEMNAKGDGQIKDVPMLMIDDEADNASINTNKSDLNPTKTNSLIRKILGTFAKSCYVGYTATPFANIFINPDAYSEEVREELFPRDFIYCLDAPTSYFGPDSVFLNQNISARTLEEIRDGEEFLPLTHKKDHDVSELPQSLYRAINQFVIVRAIRNLRGDTNQHCSMMVNVSRFVAVQNSVRTFISIYEKKLREAVKANYALPEAKADHNAYMQALKKTFFEDFSGCGFVWTDIMRELCGVFDNLRLYAVNSHSDETLDYKKYEREGRGLTAIAVGGLSLSRGITIEGLCISYMYRNTRMYDTLMQMGRWFGYRSRYDDLCRIHLSPDSINWYEHIAEASEELRQQIKEMRRHGRSPKQFGLYVMAHPDRLLITAMNKMHSGEQMTVKQNFSGKLRESSLLPSDLHINAKNEQLIADYWKTGFGKGKSEVHCSSKGWFINDVPISVIEEFISKFYVHPIYEPRKSESSDYLHRISGKHTVGDVLLVSIAGNGEDKANFRLGVQKRTCKEIEGGGWQTSKHRVASRGDEKLGLSPHQQEMAEKKAEKDGVAPSDIHYRRVRDKPLLMLHVLQPSKCPQQRVPALGISFPGGDYSTEVDVVANAVWVNLMLSAPDIPGDEDDDDEYDD